jgi:hypothetical protein
MQRWMCVPALFALVLAAGCQGDQKKVNDLKMIGVAYHNFCDTFKRGPADEKELAPYYENDARLSEALRSGRYVFLWGVSVEDIQADAGTTATVLAYEADAPAKGGHVLMADASVRSMTPQEFQAAPKAKPRKTPPH